MTLVRQALSCAATPRHRFLDTPIAAFDPALLAPIFFGPDRPSIDLLLSRLVIPFISLFH